MAFDLPQYTKTTESLLSVALEALGLDAGPEQRARLLGYVSLLQRWNSVHNLSATRDATELLRLHIIDCLAIVQPLTRYARGRSLHALDAGSGAGLPAVVMSIMLPDWIVTAVDAVGKKTAFLRQVAGELALVNLRPLHARLESISSNERGFDVVASRAFSSLRLFVETTRHLIDPRGMWVAMKGKTPQAEILHLPPECQLFHVEPLVVPGLHAERCLVWMKPTQEIGHAH